MKRRLSRLLVALLTFAAVAVLAPAQAEARPAPGPAPTTTLVLYDRSGGWGWLGEVYATAAANLSGHFGTYDAHPVSSYTAGEIAAHTATIYIGSSYDEPLPAAFLSDVRTATKPVVWLNYNIWQLESSSPTWTQDRGWHSGAIDTSTVGEVRYKGGSLTRYAANNGGIVGTDTIDPAKATVLAEAVRSDGTTFPWAVRTGNLTYIGEVPFAYQSENDRYLIFSDLLFDALAPQTAERHRALVRIEDVNPTEDPVKLRAIADYLSSQGVPFSFGVFPVYTDPNGTYNNGVPETITLRDAPEVVAALKYMISKGGTMIMHGYTHQLSSTPNPYNGVSGDDFEFYRAHVDAQNYVVLDGPVSGDSAKWALDRVNASFSQLKAVGLPQPTIFEFPHYAGSVTDYRAIGTKFTTRYERALYPEGALTGAELNTKHTVPVSANYEHQNGQFFPYVVKDVYGTKVIPENIGNYEPQSYNNHPTRFPADMIATAQRNLVVRDGFASFFFHPYLDIEALKQTVAGIKAAGYTFVAAGSV